MRRRITKIAGVSAIAVAVVVAVGATVAWFFFVQQTKTAINQWAETQRENGLDATWQSLRFTGYPLRIDTHIDTPQMIVRRPDRRAIWKPTALTFKISSIAPHAINFVGPGYHELYVNYGDAAWAAVVEAETLKGQALFPPRDYRRIEQLAGEFAGVRVTPFAWADPVVVDRGNFRATLGAMTPADPLAHPLADPLADPASLHPQGDSLALDLAARDIDLPGDLLKGSALETLGPFVNAFSIELRVKGELDSGSASIDALTAWRDGGGTVEFTSIELQWGPLRLTADGTLALDGNLQPVGSFATQTAGLEKFVSAMEAAGYLSPNDAAIARITLAILTRPAEDGGPDRAKIPISLQERTLRLGPVALIQFPPISWQ